ncbi:MAG: hypothetical protein LKI80_08065 [Sporolactobacillus sp.]|jgi:hypothetical protein|nr:hypothetical protein [Sporolactobacillus sp.]
MAKERIVCKEHLTVVLDFCSRPGLADFRNNLAAHPGPQQIRAFRSRLSERLERIARMVEILRLPDEGWVVSGKKNRIILESDRADFQTVVDRLTQHGFYPSEYRLLVEYERKWGML